MKRKAGEDGERASKYPGKSPSTSCERRNQKMTELVASTPSTTAKPRRSKPAKDQRRPPILLVAGNKGGVGKSMTSLVLVDRLLSKGKDVLLIETDTANPDVCRCLDQTSRSDADGNGQLSLEMLLLDGRDGWMDLVDVIDERPERIVVINTAARMGTAIREHAAILCECLPELRRELITLWVINRQRDSMDQLIEHRRVFPNSVTHVVRNGAFGAEEKFELYHRSDLRRDVESSGGKSLTLPDLADRVADTLYTERLAISDGISGPRRLPLGNRAELTRWRNECERAFGSVLGCL